LLVKKHILTPLPSKKSNNNNNNDDDDDRNETVDRERKPIAIPACLVRARKRRRTAPTVRRPPPASSSSATQHRARRPPRRRSPVGVRCARHAVRRPPPPALHASVPSVPTDNVFPSIFYFFLRACRRRRTENGDDGRRLRNVRIGIVLPCPKTFDLPHTLPPAHEGLKRFICRTADRSAPRTDRRRTVAF